MKGVVFTEFLEFVEQSFDVDMVEDIITDANLPHGGAYTAVGSYPHSEMSLLCGALAVRSGKSVSSLIQEFGHHLSTFFHETFPEYFTQVKDFGDFLESVDQRIHVEVRKLYPDAELPEIEVLERTPEHLRLVYRSSRHLSDLAIGLIEQAATYFGTHATVTVEGDPGPEDNEIYLLVSTS